MTRETSGYTDDFKVLVDEAIELGIIPVPVKYSRATEKILDVMIRRARKERQDEMQGSPPRPMVATDLDRTWLTAPPTMMIEGDL